LNQVVCKDGNCKLYEKFFAEAIKLKQPVIPAIRVFLSGIFFFFFFPTNKNLEFIE